MKQKKKTSLEQYDCSSKFYGVKEWRTLSVKFPKAAGILNCFYVQYFNFQAPKCMVLKFPSLKNFQVYFGQEERGFWPVETTSMRSWQGHGTIEFSSHFTFFVFH
jgi:hypothetical protein